MAQGEVRCPCGKVCGSPNALWTHVQGKALHGDPEHQAMYSEDGFPDDVDGQEDEETVESEDKDQEGSKGENILDDYRENVEDDAMNDDSNQVRQLESPDTPADKSEYRKIADIDTEELPKDQVKQALSDVLKENPDAEIETNTDKNWMQRDIR